MLSMSVILNYTHTHAHTNTDTETKTNTGTNANIKAIMALRSLARMLPRSHQQVWKCQNAVGKFPARMGPKGFVGRNQLGFRVQGLGFRVFGADTPPKKRKAPQKQNPLPPGWRSWLPVKRYESVEACLDLKDQSAASSATSD